MPDFRDRILELRRVPARELAPNPKNWREHPRAQMTALRSMLEEVGFADVALAWTNEAGEIELIDGHARQELSDPDQLIPTLLLDVTREEADKLLLTLDPITEMADANRAALRRLMGDVGSHDKNLQQLLEGIRRRAGLQEDRPAGRDPEATPAMAETPAITQPGDLWLLGDHRLLCGDATRRPDVKRLMDGARARLHFTDPPYGVTYAAEHFETIRNDDLRRGELVAFLAKAFKEMVATAAEHAAFYIWHASATRDAYTTAMRAAGLVELQQIIWVKPALVLGRADYQWQHEPCFYAARDGEHPEFYGLRSESTVWHVEAPAAPGDVAISIGRGLVLIAGGEELYITTRVPKNNRLRTISLEDQGAAWLVGPQESDAWQFTRDSGRPDHPTQKPVALADRAIENSTRPGELVVDLFSGSGSTLIAAEHAGRRCYAMELEPRYCDVIVKRWEAFTGGTATRAK